jgi:hypothetical protein
LACVISAQHADSITSQVALQEDLALEPCKQKRYVVIAAACVYPKTHGPVAMASGRRLVQTVRAGDARRSRDPRIVTRHSGTSPAGFGSEVRVQLRPGRRKEGNDDDSGVSPRRP